MRKNRLLVIIAALVAVNLAVGTWVLKMFAENESNSLAKLDLIPQAMYIIKNNYVDAVDTEKLVYGALKGMLDSLDIHSQFLPPAAVEGMEVETSGMFGGLGIEITKRQGFVTVVSAIARTPAYRAGLMAGDKIVKIDDDTLHDPDLNDVVSKLRGEPGTKVTVTVLRGQGLIRTFTMTRAVIKVPSILEARILEDSIGYVKIAQFQERTAAELSRTLTELEGQGMSALILDLRDNPGGLLVSAVEVADVLLPGGHVIVSTKGRRPSQNQEFVSQDSPTDHLHPMAVLINGASASGSEILAGAVKDLKRGFLVGEKTYGKASVQTILRLGQGTGLRLTTAKYYTPSGTSIQDKGVEPDVAVPVTVEQEMQRRMQKYQEMEKAIQEEKEEKPKSETEKPSPESQKPEVESEKLDLPDTELEGLTEKKPEKGEFVDVQLQEAVRILKALKAIGADKVALTPPTKAAQ